MPTVWKAPNRPNNEISQTYNDGIVKIYAVEDVAEPGYRPEEKLVLKNTVRYQERQLGIQRYYAGRQNQVQIERVIRVPRGVSVDTQDVAVTEDGHQFRIDMVQGALDVWPASLDLTLAKIAVEYEVEE